MSELARAYLEGKIKPKEFYIECEKLANDAHIRYLEKHFGYKLSK
jgi:hypothetical protein